MNYVNVARNIAEDNSITRPTLGFNQPRIRPDDDIPAPLIEGTSVPTGKPSAANGLNYRGGFPHHEIVQRLAGFVGDKFNHGCIIDEAEDRGCVRNQIEWIDQVIESSNDPQQCVVGDLIVFTAVVGTD